MAPNIINFESSAKKETPAKKETAAKKPPKLSWLMLLCKSSINRVTKDLFRVKKSKLNNAKSGMFLGRTVNAKNYSLMGSKKRLKTPDTIVCNTDRLYTKAKQYKELKQPIAYEGLSLHEILYWEKLESLQYREEAAKAKAEAKAKAKAEAKAILSLQK